MNPEALRAPALGTTSPFQSRHRRPALRLYPCRSSSLLFFVFLIQLTQTTLDYISKMCQPFLHCYNIHGLFAKTPQPLVPDWPPSFLPDSLYSITEKSERWALSVQLGSISCSPSMHWATWPLDAPTLLLTKAWLLLYLPPLMTSL